MRTRAQADRIGGLRRVYHVICLFREHRGGLKIALLLRGGRPATARIAASPSTDNQLTSASCCLPAPSAARARPMSERSGALPQITVTISPQGPIWVDPDNNHCFLTPRLARSVPGCQFKIFWEADAPERPDPYLSNLDLTAIGTRLEKSNDLMTKRSNHLRIVK